MIQVMNMVIIVMYVVERVSAMPLQQDVRRAKAAKRRQERKKGYLMPTWPLRQRGCDNELLVVLCLIMLEEACECT